MRKRLMSILLGTTIALGLLMGCATRKPATPAPGAPGAPAAPQPAAQTLTMNLGSEPPQLDSAITTDTLSFDVLTQVSEGLVRPAEGGRIEKGSGQAADWNISPDGLTYSFKLKDGLKWSDGQPVTAKDFAYAWFRALDPKTASQYNYQLFYIKGAQAWSSLSTKDADFATKYDALKKDVAIATPDDKTITVTLTGPTPYFLGLTAFPTYLPQRQDIVQKFADKYASDADKMVYNGPFVVKSWQHDSELILEKNPNYWDAASVKLQTVDFKMIKESNTAINMYEAGQLDSVGLPGQYIAAYKDKPGFHHEAQTTTFYLEFNLANAAKKYLQNAHIRHAFSLAIDRKQFVDAVLKNGSEPATGLVPSTINIAGKAYREQAGPLLDVAAKQADAQAELAAGLKELRMDKLPPLDFLTDSGDVAKKLAQGVQGMVQQGLPGVTINIVPVDFKVRLDRMAKGDFDIVFAGWGADYDDPMTFMGLFITGGPQNDPKWSNKEYDGLIADAAKNPDQSKRLADFKRSEQILLTELPIVPIYHPAANGIRKPYVKGIISFSVGPEFDLKYTYIEGKS